MRPILRSLLLLGVTLLGAGPARAATVFSTFGLADAFNVSAGWTLSLNSPFDGSSVFQGDQFTPGSAFSLDRVELAAGLVTGPNELDVRLMSDNAGSPGNLIEVWHFSGALGPLGGANSLLGADSALNPVLQPGTAYWLVAAPSHSGTHAAWNLNAIGASGLHAASINGNPFNVSSNAPGAFRILGTPFAGGPHIPEPSSLALLGFGAAAVWLRRQRRG